MPFYGMEIDHIYDRKENRDLTAKLAVCCHVYHVN